MNLDFTIGVPGAADYAAIAALVRAAFEKAYGSGDGEVALVARLRAEGDAVVELVARDQSGIVGHVLFSRLAVEPATIRVAALAPVCVAIDRQKSGIGSALIREGLARCRAQGFDAVAVLGDPEYYCRFGFTLDAARVFSCPYSGPHFLAMALRAGVLSGATWKLTYPAAFD